MKYPEIFETENLDLWFEKYLTKQAKSREWDLMVTEELPDVFSIPFFTQEFCDKFVENIKDLQFNQSNRWGTPTNILSIERLNLQELTLNLITEFLYPIAQHYWVINGKKWENMNIDPQILKFQPQQELRLHHDFCSITMSCVLDEESKGGELMFEKYGTIKPVPGTFYIFPGQITHRYGMKRIKNKERYIFNIYGYAN